jgi:cytochrome b involved in lipid metabolism
MNKILFFLIIISIFFIGITQKAKIENTIAPANETSTKAEQVIDKVTQDKTNILQTYIKNEVGVHDSVDDCWFIIDKSVYDITEYVSDHPGGIIIAQGCGIDATQLFNSIPDHGKKALQILDSLKIGELTE